MRFFGLYSILCTFIGLDCKATPYHGRPTSHATCTFKHRKTLKKILEIAFMKMPPRKVHPSGFSEATGEIPDSDNFKCDF